MIPCLQKKYVIILIKSVLKKVSITTTIRYFQKLAKNLSQFFKWYNSIFGEKYNKKKTFYAAKNKNKKNKYLGY